MKKHLVTLFVGLVLFLTGIACFYIESVNYNISSNLTSNFELQQKSFDYKITSNDTFIITNDDSNNNMKLYIDNTLFDEVKVVVIYADILKIGNDYDTKVYDDKQIITIDIESDLIIDMDAIEDLYKLGITSINNKTIYNYTLLKYPEIRIFVNENYKKNIKFADRYGHEYNPIK